MFFSRWTLFQGLIIAVLIALAFIADLFKTDISASFSSSNEVDATKLIILLFIIVVIGLLSLLMYFETKKSKTFLKHSLWDKMHMIMLFFFVISLVIIFSVFMIDPFSSMVQNNRWFIYILLYYVLFLINVIVLAFIHRSRKQTISNENKIKYSFIWTSISLIVIIFLI